MPHNENSRVKIPALVHFTRLGYKYISLRKYEGVIDDDTNILVDVLCDAINRINATSLTTTDVQKIVNALKAMLENDDLGREFYSVLINGYNGLKLIDFEDFGGTVNSYHVVTEMTCKNGSDEFRPDITPLINGIPLAFIEVKKPNNKGGIKAEYDRMLMRVKNKKFRRFINLTQIMVFSNNSEYDDTEAVPLEGAFYSTISYEKLFFSHFREEDEKLLTSVPEKDEAVENFILTDNNLSSIKYSPEYVTNSSPVSPTNRIITSLFSFERILTFLKYAIAYVERTDENGITHLEKHLMRYPQFFATKAIENKLNAGVKNGIIWHTQGSGKTALAYYNVRYLTDYYQKHGTIAKFYFIVDRLDLLTQAANEFRARGLHVEETNSKEDFIKNIHSTGTVNNTGKPTITVVNIQKFSKESIAKQSDYAVNVQRIYFLDEAHRSYKPTGSFLANLLSSDREAVMIALTGTPLIGTIYDDDGKPIAGKKYDSKSVFGNYISDEAHRSQINLDQKVKVTAEGVERTYGFAKYLHDSLPNATYVGFTGTPVDGTIEVFGPVVDAYTMAEAVKDGITVNLVYDGRAARVTLDQAKVREIEDYYDRCAVEGANEHQIEESQKAVAHIDAIIGDPDRLHAVAEDFINHYETRVAEEATVAGKAMFVCSNRKIACGSKL